MMEVLIEFPGCKNAERHETQLSHVLKELKCSHLSRSGKWLLSFFFSTDLHQHFRAHACLDETFFKSLSMNEKTETLPSCQTSIVIPFWPLAGWEAAGAGLQPGQVVLKVNGNNVNHSDYQEVLEHFAAQHTHQEAPGEVRGFRRW